MATLKEVFNEKVNENGDKSFYSTGDKLLDIFFKSEYYRNNLNRLPALEPTDKNKLFALFMRDCRNGMGQKNVGNRLISKLALPLEEWVSVGRFDDLWKEAYSLQDRPYFKDLVLDYLRKEVERGNALAKKWMPRYHSKNLTIARDIAKYYKMSKQTYGKFIKVDTVEKHLSLKEYDKIVFSQVPSLASLKYFSTFLRNGKTRENYKKYIEDVKSGEAKLNTSVLTPYDIYKNRDKIEADVFFDKLEKISGSWIPIVDTSSSMVDRIDSMSKAISIGHYLSKCSSTHKDLVISFSSNPKLIELSNNSYKEDIESIYTGDCTRTNLKAVMDKLIQVDKGELPDYLVVLSDMEFDLGSSDSIDAVMEHFKELGVKTNILWWNFNSRGETVPKTDKYGNVYMSGYSAKLLKFLEAGFDGHKYLNTLLESYAKLTKSRYSFL